MGFGKGAVWQAPRVITITFPTNAAILTAPNVVAFIADADYEVLDVAESHGTLGTDGSAVTLDVAKCTGTQTPAQGVSMLTTTFNLKATINTVVRKSQASGLIISSGKSKLQITKGDRIAIVLAGTLTAVTGVNVTIVLKPTKKKGSY